MVNPVPGKKITTPYGKPGKMWKCGYHVGADFAAPTGTPVVACTDGKVLEAKEGVSWGASYGKAIVIVPSMPRLYGSVDSLSGHHRRFTFNELRQVAELSGFEVELIRYFNPIAIAPYWFLYRVIGMKSVGSRQLGIYDRILVPVANQTMRLFNGRIPGVNLIAVLRAAPSNPNSNL